ncbi:sugar phosphate isomerase/epimerase [Pullulanibacillus pueri]|uniref:Xylose isomerase n=1 Tax=Pullulanibacillus pueri TaxID=1437324 RepID=A0A8J2ZVF6_9BACL|nr:sugar phosphate isomerase/epimerase family protein [Pullulanibacillus pueri]MBM7681658.1 sugar phosphate isomerase/epimerase [Pullulanibacillus pueri]GGH79278.1 xylose isomerase [Pullulanibacillus pueri]
MSHFKLALNTSTLLAFQLDIIEQIKVTAQAGYEGIELWVKDIESYLEKGGSLKELKQLLETHGLSVVNAITFFKWTDGDETVRQAGLLQAEREMALLYELGCRAVAAPPSGDVKNLSLETMAIHFTELVEKARRIGIEPYLEFWGRSIKLHNLSEAMYIAMESGKSDIKLLLDLFHMYTGGSSVDQLAYIQKENIGIIHVNDYPAFPTQTHIADQDRVFPGDGIAPIRQVASYLDAIGYEGFLSLELFNDNIGSQTPLAVATEGIRKIKTTFYLEDQKHS